MSRSILPIDKVGAELATATAAIERVNRTIAAFVPRADNVAEAKKLVALAKATAALAAAVKDAKEHEHLAGVLVVNATTKLAQAEVLEKQARPKGRPKKVAANATIPRRQLEAESRRRHLPSLSDNDREAYFAASHKAGATPTVTGAAALARLEAPERTTVLAKLGDVADVKKAIGEVKRERKRTLGAELDAKPVPQPTGRFDVIVIDPPWRYEKRVEDESHRGRNQYPDMTLEQICAVPVGDRAADDCILWLWTTNAFMRGAFQCLDAWGFEEKSILTWAKSKMGVGDWLRGQTEHCILAVRGKPIVTLTNQTTLLQAPTREHSRKPDEFYALVEKLCHGTKLDMFAREPRAGWVLWGAETNTFGDGER